MSQNAEFRSFSWACQEDTLVRDCYPRIGCRSQIHLHVQLSTGESLPILLNC